MAYRLLLLGVALVYGGLGLSTAASLFNGTCYTDVGQSKFSIAPDITFPAPYTYCFKLQANAGCGGSTGSGPCCKNSTAMATFLLDLSEYCQYDAELFTVTFDGKPHRNFMVDIPAKGGFGTAAVFTVPGLKLDSKTLEANDGAQLCLNLKRTNWCGSIEALAPWIATTVGGSWNAALLIGPTTTAAGGGGTTATTTTTSPCCPVTALKMPDPVECETCWVWDVRGPKGTATSAKYDFLSRNSCPLASLEPRLNLGWDNCCEYEAYWIKMNAFDELRSQGLVTGFDKPICERTSMKLCGTFSSASHAQAAAIQYGNEGNLRFDFDNTDDTCPMSLIDSTVRLRSVLLNGTRDRRCSPLNLVVEDICWEPVLNVLSESLQDALTAPFPNNTCNTAARTTPFTIDQYYEVLYTNTTTDYCVQLATARPLRPAKSGCANANVLDRVSFWMRNPPMTAAVGVVDDSVSGDGEGGGGGYIFGMEDTYLGAYLLTKEKGSNTYDTRTELKASWGQPGENVYEVRSLGLDVDAVQSKQPKICIKRSSGGGHLWEDTVDPMGFLWTALYDDSGKCCPVYYSNRF